MEATPLGHDELAVAVNRTGEPTALLFTGEVTHTPDWVEIVTGIILKVDPPQ
jgi:hypothetical protein